MDDDDVLLLSAATAISNYRYPSAAQRSKAQRRWKQVFIDITLIEI